MPEMMSTKGPLVKKDIRIWASCPYGHVLNLSKADAKHGSFPFGCPKGTFRQYTHTHIRKGLVSKWRYGCFQHRLFALLAVQKRGLRFRHNFAAQLATGEAGEAAKRLAGRRPEDRDRWPCRRQICRVDHWKWLCHVEASRHPPKNRRPPVFL